jgi:hypothetical protein
VYHRRNRLSGSARFFNSGAHFFRLDFIVAHYAPRQRVSMRYAPAYPKLVSASALGFENSTWHTLLEAGGFPIRFPFLFELLTPHMTTLNQDATPFSILHSPFSSLFIVHCSLFIVNC